MGLKAVDEKWIEIVNAFLVRPLRETQIEYFDSSRIEPAKSWMRKVSMVQIVVEGH
jgi:hypothetical protein